MFRNVFWFYKMGEKWTNFLPFLEDLRAGPLSACVLHCICIDCRRSIFAMHAKCPKYGEVLTSNCCKSISRKPFPQIFFVSDTQYVEIELRKRYFRHLFCARTDKETLWLRSFWVSTVGSVACVFIYTNFQDLPGTQSLLLFDRPIEKSDIEIEKKKSQKYHISPGKPKF